MTLEPSGVAGKVSGYIESDHIVEGRLRDRVHVQVYRVPEDDATLVESELAHDVVLREAEDAAGNREVVESWGSFASAEDACVQALDLAETHHAPIWDDIIRLARSDGLETVSSDKEEWGDEAFLDAGEAAFGGRDDERE